VRDTLLSHELIIGTDFINMIEMNIKAGEISISPLTKPSCVKENLPEIYQIDLDPEENDEVNVSHISDRKYQN